MPSSLAGVVVWLSRSPELALLVKATLVLLAGLAVARLAVRARASVRHLVVASSFVALVALPLVIAFVPAIAIEVPAPAVHRLRSHICMLRAARCFVQ